MLTYWLLQTLSMAITALLIPGLMITSIFGALITVLALAFINASIWDAALFFSIPDSFTMQALMLFGANGLIFWVLVKLLPGIEVRGFLPAFIAPVVFTLTSLVISNYAADIDWERIFDQSIATVTETKDYLKTNASN